MRLNGQNDDPDEDLYTEEEIDDELDELDEAGDLDFDDDDDDKS